MDLFSISVWFLFFGVTFYQVICPSVFSEAIIEKLTFFPVNNVMAICFSFTHTQVLRLLSWTFDFSFRPCTTVVISSLTQSILVSTQLTVMFFDWSAEPSSQCHAIEFPYFLHGSIPIDTLVCTCDLKIVTVEDGSRMASLCC